MVNPLRTPMWFMRVQFEHMQAQMSEVSMRVQDFSAALRKLPKERKSHVSGHAFGKFWGEHENKRKAPREARRSRRNSRRRRR
jgi:hypothetical protein